MADVHIFPIIPRPIPIREATDVERSLERIEVILAAFDIANRHYVEAQTPEARAVAILIATEIFELSGLGYAMAAS